MLWNLFWELNVEDGLPETPHSAEPRAVVMPHRLRISTNAWSIVVTKPDEIAAVSRRLLSNTVPANSEGAGTSAASRPLEGPEPNTNLPYLGIRVTISTQSISNESAQENYKMYVRRIVNQCISNCQVLSPRSDVAAELKKKLKFRGPLNELKRRLREMGYFWFVSKMYPIKNILVESSALRLRRADYLQAIQRYRAEGRPIIFLSRYFNYFSRGRDPYNTFTLNANSATERAPHSIDMYEVDYSHYFQDKMFLICQNWIRSKVIPNVPPNAAIVLVNLPCQNKILNPPPEPDATKQEMRSWLVANKVPVKINMQKLQLHQLILQSKDRVKRYAIDELFKERLDSDHRVVRCPPQHYDLDMTHLFWSEAFYDLMPKPIAIRETLYNSIQNHLCRMTIKKLTYLQRLLIDNERDYENSGLALDTLTDHFKLACDLTDEDQEMVDFNVDTRTLFVSSPVNNQKK